MDIINKMNWQEVASSESPIVVIGKSYLIINKAAYGFIINGAFSRYYRNKYHGQICLRVDGYGFSLFKPLLPEDEINLLPKQIRVRGCLKFNLSDIKNDKIKLLTMLRDDVYFVLKINMSKMECGRSCIKCKIFNKDEIIFDT